MDQRGVQTIVLAYGVSVWSWVARGPAFEVGSSYKRIPVQQYLGVNQQERKTEKTSPTPASLPVPEVCDGGQLLVCVCVCVCARARARVR